MLDFSFAITFLALFSALLGALLALYISLSHKYLCALISFAAGSLFGITFFEVLPHGLTHIGWLLSVILIAAGYYSFDLIGKYIFHLCPACSASHFDKHHHAEKPLKNIVILLISTLLIHNLIDGFGLTIGEKINTGEHSSIGIGIIIHKFPEGLALCSLFLAAGFQKSKALLFTIFLECFTFIGWFLGKNFFSENLDQIFGMLLVFIGGNFLYLAIHAVSGELKKHSPRSTLFYCLSGFLFLGLCHFFLSTIGGHDHGNEPSLHLTVRQDLLHVKDHHTH